jgi:hypothetical protein
MGWLALACAALMAAMAISVGSFFGFIFAVLAAALTAPPVWRYLKTEGFNTRPLPRWGAAIIVGFAAMVANSAAYSETPEGKAANARRQAEERALSAREGREVKAKADAESASKEAEIASGEHCLSGWDGSFPALKEAVKQQLRDPRSFEHVSTDRSPVDKKGSFGLVMTYRAENGFGGMNVEAVGVEVDARSCRFETASVASLAKRLRQKPSN